MIVLHRVMHIGGCLSDENTADFHRRCFRGLDKSCEKEYDNHNYIGQFVTILSVNKTRDFGWAQCAHFLLCGWGTIRIFLWECVP